MALRAGDSVPTIIAWDIARAYNANPNDWSVAWPPPGTIDHSTGPALREDARERIMTRCRTYARRRTAEPTIWIPPPPVADLVSDDDDDDIIDLCDGHRPGYCRRCAVTVE